METGVSGRLRQFKKKTFKSQEERRNAVLQRQQAARRNLTDHARMLALGALELSSSLPESADNGQADPTTANEAVQEKDHQITGRTQKRSAPAKTSCTQKPHRSCSKACVGRA